jgi:L-ascorbate metabolism protein UlaG (beta-lactamase superfamily)
LGGALSLGAGAGFQLWSLSGAFDHRTRAWPAGRRELPERLLSLADQDVPSCLHIGHSTHLLQLGRKRVLTDPWFHDPAHGGMEHALPAALSPEAIGALSAILITHEHPDHFDPIALDRMDKRAHAIVATESMRAHLRKLGFASVTVLSPWQGLQLGELVVHAVPALHDVYEVGYVLEHASARVYFAGDTTMHPALEEIRERFAPTTAILPIDGTRYRFGEQWVMSPEQAALAAVRLGVRQVLPTHHEARYGGAVLRALLEPERAPVTRLRSALATLAPAIALAAPAPGELELLAGAG